MIQESDWKWFGAPAHFICAEWCRFHLATQVGKYVVSTVGEYFPDEGTREVLAKIRGIDLLGKGDQRRYDYMRKIGFEDIGYQRKYETMVFTAGKPCDLPDCNCGLPKLDPPLEIESHGYNRADEATKGHLEMCRKWAKEGQ